MVVAPDLLIGLKITKGEIRSKTNNLSLDRVSLFISVSPDQIVSLNKLEGIPHNCCWGVSDGHSLKGSLREEPVLLRRERFGGERKKGGVVDREQALWLFTDGPSLKE